MLTHLSLCTGIGGIDLAAEWAGFTTVGQCEIDEYASKLLAKNFKGVPNLHDIRTVTASRLRENGIKPNDITVLSAGFPCQPYSLAGKGKGDGDERDLWGEVKRCIGEIKPRWFVGENTPGLFARANQKYFKRILADLAALGYRVSWGIWGAVDVGAPHKRERVFICAHRNAYGEHDDTQREVRKKNIDACGVRGEIPDTTCKRRYTNAVQRREPAESGNTTNEWRIQSCWVQSVGIRSGISDAAGNELGLQRSAEETARVASCRQDNRAGTQGNASGEWWKVEPDVGRVVNGVPARVDRLRCLGNAVVPWQVLPLLEEISEYEVNHERGRGI